MADQSEPDDVSGHYMAHRQDLEEQSALSEMLQNNAQQAQPAAQPGAPAAQAAPAAAGGSYDQQIESIRQAGVDKANSKGGAIAKDIVGGAVESPFAIIGGVRDAYQNMLNLADEVNQWGREMELKKQERAEAAGITGGPENSEQMKERFAQEDANRGSDGELPDANIMHPTTVTGSLIKGVAQFLTGFNKVGALADAAGAAGATGAAAYAINAAKGAGSSFAAFDPLQARLSNLIEEFPALSNPVTRWMEAKPDDTQAMGRLKNGLEGLGLGSLTDLFIRGLSMLKDIGGLKKVDPNAPWQALENPSDLETNVPRGTSPPAPTPSPLGNAEEGQPLVYPRSVSQEGNNINLLGEKSPTTPESVTMAAGGKNAIPTTHEIDQDGTHFVNSENGATSAIQRGDTLQILGTQTSADAQGKGEATARMERMVQEAEDRGLTLTSDSKVSYAAAKVYDRLEDRGYEVTRNPAEPDGEGNLQSTAGRPVFEVRTPEGAPEKFQPPGAPPPAGAEQGPGRINFARIQSPDDVKRVMQQLANEHLEEIDQSRRGVQTFEQIKLNAEQENAWDILNSRRVGQPLNAEQITAARQLWVTSAQKLGEIAQTARDAPTEQNLADFVKMVEIHRVIQNEVRGAQTETARALAAMRIPVGASENRLAQIGNVLREGYGGTENVRDLATKVAGLSDANMPNELESFLERSRWARTRDALLQAWTDGLLTSPTTQTRIFASNITTALWRMGERAIAERISASPIGSGTIAPGEAAAMWQAYSGGWKDTFAYGAKAFRTGVTGEGIGEPQAAYPSKLSSEALQLSSDSLVGKAADFLGTVLSIPRRAIAAQHDMALTQAYRAELNAQALRTATNELNAGRLNQDNFEERVADLIQNPPPNLQMNAQSAGKYQAFLDEPGAIAQKLLELRQEVPAFRIIMPFIKIPARIFTYTMERTPLAPLVGQFKESIAAGGARRDLAIGQVGLGTFASLAIADMTMSGLIKAQGPREKSLEQAQEREGAMPWSVKIGNKWVSYNGIDPAGKLIGLAAAATEAIVHGQNEVKDDADVENIWAATTLAVAANLTNSSYTQGLSNFFAAVHDSKTGGGSSGESALFSTVGSVIPSGVAATARAVDPYQRAVYSMIDEFKSRIPGLSKDLPPKRDMWGKPVPSGYGPITDMLSPVQARDSEHSPIDDEIKKQGMNVSMPSSTQNFNGVRVDLKHYPAAYSRFLELSGNGYKDPAWGMGAKDLLDSVVSGSHPLSALYNLRSDGPDGGKETMVRDILSKYRDGAKRQLLKEYPEIGEEVSDGQANARALRMPTM